MAVLAAVSLILTLTEPWLYVRELSLDLLIFVRELTSIIFEEGRKKLTLDRRV